MLKYLQVDQFGFIRAEMRHPGIELPAGFYQMEAPIDLQIAKWRVEDGQFVPLPEEE